MNDDKNHPPNAAGEASDNGRRTESTPSCWKPSAQLWIYNHRLTASVLLQLLEFTVTDSGNGAELPASAHLRVLRSVAVWDSSGGHARCNAQWAPALLVC